MRVKVKTYATLREVTGGVIHYVDIGENATLKDALDRLFNKFPDLKGILIDESGNIKEGYRVLINGREALHINGLESKVKQGDEIAIFPPIAGG